MFRKLYETITLNIFLTIIRYSNGFDYQIIKKIKITDCYQGTCSGIIKVDEDMCDEHGRMAAGCQFSLIDEVTSLSLTSLLIRKAHASVTLNMKCYKPANIGDDVLITSRVLKVGEELAFIEAFLKDRDTGDLIAKGTHVRFILNSSYV